MAIQGLVRHHSGAGKPVKPGARHRFTGFQKVLDSKMGKGYRWPTAVGAAHNAVKSLSGKFHIRSLLEIRTLESCRLTTKGKEQIFVPGMGKTTQPILEELGIPYTVVDEEEDMVKAI